MTEFRGRGDEVIIYPLTFKEYYGYLGGDKLERFEEYAQYGGLPLTLSRKTAEDKAKYLSDFFKEVYFKDIEERYSIDLPEVLQLLTINLCSEIGSLTNSSKIVNALPVRDSNPYGKPLKAFKIKVFNDYFPNMNFVFNIDDSNLNEVLTPPLK